MAKKNNKKSRRSGKKSDETIGMNVQMSQITAVPKVVRNPQHRFRRAITRQMSWNPAVGLDATSGAYTIQVSYAPGETNWRFGGTSIYADAVPNSTEFTSLYDSWKLVSITHRIDYTVDATAGVGVAYVPPLLLYAPDYNDLGDASISALLQYPQVRTHSFELNGYSPLIFKMSPKPLATIGGSGVLSGYSEMKTAPQLRTSEFTTPHYGVKFALQNNGASVNAVVGHFQHTVHLELEFTNPK